MTFMHLTAGKWVAQALAVAAELGIADLLKAGPKSAATLARSTAASEDGVYRLLRALASLGLFAESANRKFRLGPLGHLLCTDSPQALGAYAQFVAHESTWRPWGELGYSVRTGEPAFDRVFGMPVFEYFAKTPKAAAVFDAAMTSISTMEARAVAEAYDFSRVGTLVDVGGGHGLMLKLLLNAYQQLRGVLYDLPHVTGGALHTADLADRCRVVGGDFLVSVPKGGDAYILKHIIHDWDDERATRILRNCHRAMPSGGRLLVVDPVIPRDNSAHFGKLLDLEMLVLTPRGRERTRVEFQDLLKRSRFRMRRVVATKTHLSIVEGTKI
jgi:SAM-dependent methyltransferase